MAVKTSPHPEYTMFEVVIGSGLCLSGHFVKDIISLPIDESSDELLGGTKQDCPGKDLRGGVQVTETRNETAAHEHQPQKRSYCSGRQFEDSQGN
jgi:hypothetical protein